MHTVASRVAARWPLALSLAAIAALGACADEPVSPAGSASPRTSVQPLSDTTVIVTNTSGGTDVGSLR